MIYEDAAPVLSRPIYQTKNRRKKRGVLMNINREQYRNNPFYRDLIDRTLKNECLLREQRLQLERQRQDMIGYANQLPFHAMQQISPYTWQASYSAIENNYVAYWANAYQAQQQHEQQCRQNFKNAIDTAAHITEKDCPAASIVFDGLGILTADNLMEAIQKTCSIISKAKKL